MTAASPSLRRRLRKAVRWIELVEGREQENEDRPFQRLGRDARYPVRCQRHQDSGSTQQGQMAGEMQQARPVRKPAQLAHLRTRRWGHGDRRLLQPMAGL